MIAPAVPLGALCTLLMCSDPWPVSDAGEGDGRDEMVAFADAVAREAGFTGWIEAHHRTGNAYAATLRQPDSGRVYVRYDEFNPGEAVMRAQKAAVLADKVAYDRGYAAALAAQGQPDSGRAGDEARVLVDAWRGVNTMPKTTTPFDVLRACANQLEAALAAQGRITHESAPVACESRGEAVAEVYRVPEDWGRYEAHLAVHRVNGAQVKDGDKLYTHPAPAAPPAGVPDVRLDAERWGSALNEAAWTFIEVCPEKSTLLFNTAKTALRAAILKYLDALAAARSAPEGDGGAA